MEHSALLLDIDLAHDAASHPSTSRQLNHEISSLLPANACVDPQFVAGAPWWAPEDISHMTNPNGFVCVQALRVSATCLHAYVHLGFVETERTLQRGQGLDRGLI